MLTVRLIECAQLLLPTLNQVSDAESPVIRHADLHVLTCNPIPDRYSDAQAASRFVSSVSGGSHEEICSNARGPGLVPGLSHRRLRAGLILRNGARRVRSRSA